MKKSKMDYKYKKVLKKVIDSVYFQSLQNKTQLIPFNSLTTDRHRHTMMVCLVANCIYHKFKNICDVSLNLLILGSFTHDIGHPPFGHDGERQLHRIMHKYGGFESNAQALYILSDKLLLSDEILSSIFKHNRLIPNYSIDQKLTKGYYAFMDKKVDKFKNKSCIERKIIDFSDEIAYFYSDVVDVFLKSKVLKYSEFKKSIEYENIIKELVREFINYNVKDAINTIEDIVLNKNSFTNYVSYIVQNITYDNFNKRIEISNYIEIQLKFLKLVTKNSYFHLDIDAINIRNINEIITVMFYHYIKEFDNLDNKEKYRLSCDKICMKNDEELLNEYKELINNV